jgi:hypothetical protein
VQAAHPRGAGCQDPSRCPGAAATSELVYRNRKGGPEGVIDTVEERAPDGFTRLEDVIDPAELEAIVTGYAKSVRGHPGSAELTGWSRLVPTEFGEQTSGKYRLHVTRDGVGGDELTLKVESSGPHFRAQSIAARLRTVTGLRFDVALTEEGIAPPN